MVNTATFHVVRLGHHRSNDVLTLVLVYVRTSIPEAFPASVPRPFTRPQGSKIAVRNPKQSTPRGGGITSTRGHQARRGGTIAYQLECPRDTPAISPQDRGQRRQTEKAENPGSRIQQPHKRNRHLTKRPRKKKGPFPQFLSQVRHQ